MYNKLSNPKTSTAKFKDVKLSRIFELFRAYRLQLSVILGIALASAIIGIGPPLVMKEIIDRALPESNKQLLWILVAWMVALPLSAGLLGVWQNHLDGFLYAITLW